MSCFDGPGQVATLVVGASLVRLVMWFHILGYHRDYVTRI